MALKDEERSSGIIDVNAIWRKSADEKFDAYTEEIKGWTPEERTNAGRNTFALLVQKFQYLWDESPIAFVEPMAVYIKLATQLACSGLEKVSAGRKKEVASYFQDLEAFQKNLMESELPFDYKELNDNGYRMLVETFLCATLEPLLPAGAEYINILFTYMLLVACADTVNEKGIQAIKKLRADYFEYAPKKKEGKAKAFQGTYDKSAFMSPEERKAAEEAKKKAEAAERARKEAEKKRKAEEKRKREEKAKADAEQEAKEQAVLARKAAKLRPMFELASGLIACSGNHIVVVKADGTVVAAGKNDDGQCNVSGWRDVVSVHCDLSGTVGVTSKGTVYYTGSDLDHQSRCRGWTGIKAAGIVDRCVVGLKYNGTVVNTGGMDTGSWSGVAKLRVGSNSFFGSAAGITADRKLFHVGSSGPSYFDGEQGVEDVAIGYMGATVLLKTGGAVSARGRGGENSPIEPVELKKRKGIVRVYMSGRRPLALLGDGSIFVEPIPRTPGATYFGRDDFSDFLREHHIKKVAALCAGSRAVAILTADGKVYWFQDGFSYLSVGDQPFGQDFRVFSDIHKFAEEREEAERKAREARELAEKQRREAEQERASRREQGLCQHCGGTFKRGLFGMKCTACGTRKDY